MKKFGTNISQ